MSNHKGNVPVAELLAVIDNWRVTLPNREGDEHTAAYILDNLEDFAKHYVPENEAVESGDTIRNHVHIPGLGTGEPVTIDGTPVKVMAGGVELGGVGDNLNLTTVTLTLMPAKITVDGDVK